MLSPANDGPKDGKSPERAVRVASKPTAAMAYKILLETEPGGEVRVMSKPTTAKSYRVLVSVGKWRRW